MLSFFKSKEVLFWKWFQNNEDIIFDFETDREHIFDRLKFQLGKVNNGLTYEFGPIKDNGTREFIISADGIKNVFQAVERLFNEKPELKRWEVIKYRPRKYPINDITMSNITIKADEVNYILFDDQNPDKVGIMLFFQDYFTDEKGTMDQVGYLILDEALGEYDVETRVGAIFFESKDSEYYVQSHPLKDLAKDFNGQFSLQ